MPLGHNLEDGWLVKRVYGHNQPIPGLMNVEDDLVVIPHWFARSLTVAVGEVVEVALKAELWTNGD